MGALFGKKQSRQLLRGDVETIEAWFHSYCDALYTFVYYRVGKDSPLAGDIVQKTFLKALEHIRHYDPKRDSMFGWLTLLGKDFIEKALREKDGETPHEKIWQDIDSGLLRAFKRIATEPLPDEVIEQAETAQLVQVTLANIPANYKYVLKEYYYRLRPPREIAASMRVSEGTIKTMLHRARQAFKTTVLRLEKSFNSPDSPKEGANE